MAFQPITMIPIAVNPARNLVFFPASESSNDDSWLCYNYKTQQWTSVSGYADLILYTLNSIARDIGIVRESAGSYDLQETAAFSDEPLNATLTTGASDVNQGGRTIVTGVRPLYNGGAHAVRVGVQDNISDSVTWSSTTTVLARTGYANLIIEGRYVRAEIVTTGGFETAIGADLMVAKGGKV